MSPRVPALLCPLVLAASTLFASQLHAAPRALVEGRLELLWGDASPGRPDLPGQFQAHLVDDAGVRHPLDAARARQAAGDLYALAGRRVAMELDVAAAASGRLSPSLIVAAPDAGDLAGSKSGKGGGSGSTGSTGGSSSGSTTTTTTGSGIFPDAPADRWLTLMCKFADVSTEPRSQAYFQGMYDNLPGRVDYFWREVSYGKRSLGGSSAAGWFPLPQPRSYYIVSGKADLTKLFTDCTAAADGAVDFAANGGPVGVNLVFNADLDGYAWGGARCATLDGVNKCWKATWIPPFGYNDTASIVHEMGHGYGLPHANNSDADASTYDNPWDIMSDQWDNVARDATYGMIAKHFSSYSRNRLGFVDAARKYTIVQDGTYANVTLDRASLAGSTNWQMMVVTLPGTTTHYYTIETRKRSGTYEAALAGDAVIVHDVDTTRAQPAWSVDAGTPAATVSNNEGSMFKVGESYTAPNNAFSLTVQASTTDGFVLTVVRGDPAALFVSGFETAAP